MSSNSTRVPISWCDLTLDSFLSNFRYQGYWYHPRFHRLSSEQDLEEIQSNRRKRDTSRPTEKSHKSTKRSARVKAPASAEMPRDVIDFPEPEGVHTHVLDSMASLFTLASLVQDDVINGGFVANGKEVTPSTARSSLKGTGIESHSLSSFISCTPIRLSTCAVPFLQTASGLKSRQVTGASSIDDCEGMDSGKENPVDNSEWVDSFHLATDQCSPLTPVNNVYQGGRSPPSAYDTEIAQLLCSPNRQRPSAILTENRKPILFSFRGGSPVDIASPGAIQRKTSPSQSESKPEAAKSS